MHHDTKDIINKVIVDKYEVGLKAQKHREIWTEQMSGLLEGKGLTDRLVP
jgi:hypothetical protein